MRLLLLLMVCTSFQAFAFDDEDMKNVEADVVETDSGFTVTFREKP